MPTMKPKTGKHPPVRKSDSAARRELTEKHGIESAHWNNLGRGWQILCLCGYGTGCNLRMQDAGEDFDLHLVETVGERSTR